MEAGDGESNSSSIDVEQLMESVVHSSAPHKEDGGG